MFSSKLDLGNRSFTWGTRTYVMGILNITPDSFSGDGLLVNVDPSASQGTQYREEAVIAFAMDQAQRYLTAGVDMIDVGGESTRPGSEGITSKEEINRVLPVIRALVDKFDVPISIDTYKADVAQAALEGGAKMVNDVWGLHADPDLADVVTKFGVPIILMHNRSSWTNAEIKARLGGRYIGVTYDNLMEDIQQELLASVNLARQAGMSENNIILDPGIGFGKTVEQNLELLDRLSELRAMGYPILVGPSRKSFIGYTLDQPPDQRLEGDAAAVAVAITRGADIVRVHDVDFMVKVARMTDAIVRRTGSID